jgi:ubiquinone/menaquinone biosynthesis C-methylase UbiE
MIWKDEPKLYTALSNKSLTDVLHPLIISLLNKHNPKNILDFGCGDGKIINRLSKEFNISIFDTSRQMISLALEKNKNKILNVYQNISNIPDNTFDVVIVSLVLVCIDNQSEYKKAVSNIFRSLKSGGIAIFADTHPCFRQYIYSDFSTVYSKGKPFSYFNESVPFEVILEDNSKNLSLKITDYHWSLSFSINTLIEYGFTILGVYETPDNKNHDRFNPFYPPFIIIEGAKK